MDNSEMSDAEMRFWLKVFGEEVPQNQPLKRRVVQEELSRTMPVRRVADLQMNAVNRSDKEKFDTLRKGKMPIGAKLDLHGYSLLDARIAFYSFIKNSYEAQKRVVLVVTGKGNFSGGVGAIKGDFPSWINDEHLKPMILTCCHAPKHMGGDGAVLFLLKRG